MSKRENGAPALDAILKQHRDMAAMVDDLRAFLGRPRPEVAAAGSHTWAAELTEKLTRLHDRVYRHFRHEEKSGFLDELAVKRPHAVRSVLVLRQDHDRILAGFRAIIGASLIYSEGKRPDSPGLRRWTATLLDHLSEHERDEADLLQRIHYEDLGAAD